MPEYRCIAKCFHSVDTGRGLKHRFFREGDLLSVPEGTEVPHHFIPVEEYREPARARLSNETSEGYAKRQFPPLIAPIDETKKRRGRPPAEKVEVPDGSKN